MHRELIPRADARRAAHDIPPVEHEPTGPQDRGKLRVLISEGPNKRPDPDALRRHGPREFGPTDGQPSGREQENGRSRGHDRPNPVPL